MRVVADAGATLVELGPSERREPVWATGGGGQPAAPEQVARLDPTRSGPGDHGA